MVRLPLANVSLRLAAIFDVASFNNQFMLCSYYLLWRAGKKFNKTLPSTGQLSFILWLLAAE
jgi:hypothetical protein